MKSVRNIGAAQIVRCAAYTRKSTEDGLEQDYNSLDAQREACEAYVASQRHEGWVLLPEHYDDGGFTGANMDRPALTRLIADIEAGKVDMVLVYKVDRLSRSLLDFSRLIEFFDSRGVSFISITQHFATNTAMGKLTLNMLLSFAEFERAIIAERVRDKIAGAKRKGKFTGGCPVLGYDIDPDTSKLIVNPEEAKTFRAGKRWDGPGIYRILSNKTFLGLTVHKDKTYPGEHKAIVSQALWDRAQSLPPRTDTTPVLSVPSPPVR